MIARSPNTRPAKTVDQLTMVRQTAIFGIQESRKLETMVNAGR
jgi:hypothetical protein